MSVVSVLVVAGIPFARTGREELAAAARERLERDDEDGALALLLTDRDDWATGPGPTEEDARSAMAAPTLRGAMAALRFGPVADYFAYRWSDPTYLSGLALLDAHAGECETVLELACGIGHYLRELGARGVAATGVDVVYAKCWLAKRFVAPDAQLVCADAASALPNGPFDLAFCHDALHYLPEPARVCAELARVAPRVVVGHAHNALVDNLSAGAPLDPAGYAALLPGARLFDDAELTAAALGTVSAHERQTGRRPWALTAARAPERSAEELAGAAAVAVVGGSTRPAATPFTLPRRGAALVRNPLLGSDGRVRWPSERYATEYGDASPHLAGAHPGVPERATATADTDALARARLLLDLPPAW